MTPQAAAAPSSLNRESHHRWLLDLTQIPTAAGKESRVIDWVRRWVSERPMLTMSEDSAGNLTISFGDGIRGRIPKAAAPLYFTAHMDHPAFVVDRILAPGVLHLSFRGGVMDDYFDQARIVVQGDTRTLIRLP